MHVVVRSQLWGLVFPTTLGPRDQTQEIRLGSRCLYGLSHHTGPQYMFFTTELYSQMQSKNIVLYNHE